jgi:hypothetical protein
MPALESINPILILIGMGQTSLMHGLLKIHTSDTTNYQRAHNIQTWAKHAFSDQLSFVLHQFTTEQHDKTRPWLNA